MEWARVSDDAVVIATETRAWLHYPSNPMDPFRFPMTTAGSEATTAKLLEGAIGAGLRAGRTTGPPPPPLTFTRYLWRLISYYHLTHSTPALMEEAARRFRAAERPLLAQWAEEKAQDETAHDRLALKDLEELGFSAGITAIEPPVAAALVAWFRSSVLDHALPLGVLGYAHTVERLALTQDATALAQVRAVLPAHSRAVRCLRVHSATGTDVGHVQDNVKVIAPLPAADRAHIALACHNVAKLFSTAPAEGYEDDQDLEGRFQAWRLST